jgi:Ni/Fe-hydrogenase subunit HybB-like protein
MKIRSTLKCRVIGFCTGLLVAMGFAILGLKIDIKIISMYDYNPWGISFTLIFLCVGLITGWIVQNRTTRRLVEDVEKD